MYNDIHDHIIALSNKYPKENVVAIFGGALYAYEHVNNFEKFVEYLQGVAHSAVFFKWHKGVADALRTFCHICYVDPTLVELYLGIHFNELEA